jgi:hypothetical protein
MHDVYGDRRFCIARNTAVLAQATRTQSYSDTAAMKDDNVASVVEVLLTFTCRACEYFASLSVTDAAADAVITAGGVVDLDRTALVGVPAYDQ